MGAGGVGYYCNVDEKRQGEIESKTGGLEEC